MRYNNRYIKSATSDVKASMQIYKNIVDIIDKYNDYCGDSVIIYNDTYYMYGDEESGDVVYIGKLSNLYREFTRTAERWDFKDLSRFADIVDGAVEDAADRVITAETAFKYVVREAVSKYGLG